MGFYDFEKLIGAYPHISVRRDVPASSMTTFRIGGNVRMVVSPAVEDIVHIVRLCRATDIPYRIIGCGSNLLARDEGYDGVWILTGNCQNISIRDCHAEVSAGVTLDALIDTLADAELSGLENLAGIPGSVGGAVTMNAGAFGTCISDLLVAVDVYDTKRNESYSMPYEQCNFSYRKSIFQSGRYVVLAASFRLGHGRGDLIASHAAHIREKRLASQPYEYPSAGSVFRRPRDHYAGKLIGDCGFSGYRVGDACVSQKHNGFIVNLGNASSRDVRTIIKDIRKKVFETTGVLLQTEVIME